MKEALVAASNSSELSVTIHDTSIPTPGPGQVLIKIAVTGTNPKDWKIPKMMRKGQPGMNTGDDMAGYVESVGEGVKGFSKGDRVAAFHQMREAYGSFAEYGIAWDYSTFHIPDSTSFEEAATIPLAYMTAVMALYLVLKLPLPWTPATNRLPLVIWGGASAVGAFTIKLAVLSNIHPIITVAGRSMEYVETLVDRSKGDVVLDYRKGTDALKEDIQAALGRSELYHALDAVSTGDPEIPEFISTFMPFEKGTIAVTIPVNTSLKSGTPTPWTMVGAAHDPPPPHTGDLHPGPELAAAFFQFAYRGLEQGWLAPHPHEVVPGGLNGVYRAMDDLEQGKAAAVKYVMRIEDTKA